MQFYMPVKVFEEENCVRNHTADIKRLGKKALVVTGRHSAEVNGSLADAKEALEAAGVEWVHFNEVEENPSVETIMKARDAGVAAGADMVIGIGGGSPMDAAKAIALMIRHADEPWTYMYDKTAPTDPVPIICIPTTSGTGSEVTAVSVLTRHDTGTKGSIPHRIFADLALLDGKYLATASARVTANTTMDAFAHLAESYVSTKATPYSRMCVDAGLAMWAKSRDIVLGKREAASRDYTNMLNASMFGGMSIAHTGTSLPHALGYTLTYDFGMAHGKACGYFLGKYLTLALEAGGAAAEDAAHVLTLAGFADADDFEVYFETTCGRDEVPSEILEKAVNGLLKNNADRLALAPYPVDEKVLRRMAGL